MLDFGDYVSGGSGHHGIEIARGLAVGEIAPAIAFTGLDEREVAAQAALENVMAAIELAGFFSFGNHGAVAGWCVEGGDTSATGANALGESALRIQLDLHFAAEHQLLEKFVFPDVGGNHFFDLAILQEQAKAGAVGSGVVAGNGQILGAFAAYCVDQMLRDPAEAEAADEDGGAVGKFGNGGVGRRDRKSTRLNSSHQIISYAVFCLKKKNQLHTHNKRKWTSCSSPWRFLNFMTIRRSRY